MTDISIPSYHDNFLLCLGDCIQFSNIRTVINCDTEWVTCVVRIILWVAVNSRQLIDP